MIKFIVYTITFGIAFREGIIFRNIVSVLVVVLRYGIRGN